MTFSLTTLSARCVTSVSEARAARATRKRLRAELDAYRTPAERAELDAVLSRHTTEELEQLSRATGRAYAA